MIESPRFSPECPQSKYSGGRAGLVQPLDSSSPKKGSRIWKTVGRYLSRNSYQLYRDIIRSVLPGGPTNHPNSPRFLPVRDLEHLEDRTVPALVTWDGGAGTSNWGDPANWSLDQLPGSSDQVVIPDLAGDQTILLNVHATIQSLTSAEGLKIQDKILSLTDGISINTGPLTLQNGEISVTGASTAFSSSGSVAISIGTISVSQGAKASLPNLTTATNLRLRSEDSGSLIDLPSLGQIQKDQNLAGDVTIESYGGSINLSGLKSITTINNPFYGGSLRVSGTGSIDVAKLEDLSGIQYLATSKGGGLSLPGATSWSTPSAYGYYQIQIVADDAGSKIEFPNLNSLEYGNPYGYELGFYARQGGSLNFPKLTALTKTNNSPINVYGETGGTIQLPLLPSAKGITFRSDNGANLNLGSLTTIESSEIFISGGSFQLPLLTSANFSTLGSSNGASVQYPGITTAINLRLRAENGGKIDLSNLSALKKDSAQPNDLSLEAHQGEIQLPALTAMVRINDSFGGGNVSVQGTGLLNAPLLADITGVQTVRSFQGGKLTLAGLTSWITPSTFGYYQTQIISDDAGSQIEFPNLTSLEYGNPYGYEMGFYARQGGLLSFPKLTSITKTNNPPLNMNVETGGTIQLPLLPFAKGVSFRANPGGNLQVASLASIENSEILISGGTFQLPLLTSANFSTLGVSGGASMVMTGITSAINLRLRSEGGGKLELPNLTTLKRDSNQPNETSLEANQGEIQLPALTSIVRINDSFYGASVTVQGTGILNVPLLADVTGLQMIRTYQGGQLTLPVVTSWITPNTFGHYQTQIMADDVGSLISFPNLELLGYNNNGGYEFGFYARSGGSIKLEKITSMVKNQNSPININVESGSDFHAPLLESAKGVNLNIRNKNSNIYVGKLTKFIQSSLQTSDGYQGNFSIVGMDSSSVTAYSGSKIELPKVTNAVNLQIRSENRGSLIELAGLTTLKRDTNLPNDVILEAVNGAIKLPSLVSIGRVDQAFYGATVLVQGTGTFEVPLLEDPAGLQSVRVAQGAHFSLPALKSWTTPAFNSYEAVLVAEDEGSLLQIPNLTSIVNSNPLGYQFGLIARNGGTIDLAKLTSLSKTNQGYLNLRIDSGGVLQLPLLETANQTTFDFTGVAGSVNLEKLTNANQSVFNTFAGFSLSLNSLVSATGSTFNAYSGSKIQSAGLTGAINLALRSENAGSLISLPNLTSLQKDGGLPNEVRLEAFRGTIDLPALTSVSRLGSAFHGGDVGVQGNGALKVPLLADMTGLDLIQVSQGGVLSLPSVSSINTPNYDSADTLIYSDDPGSMIDFPNLVTLNNLTPQSYQISLNARYGGTIKLAKIETVTATPNKPINLNINGGGSLLLPALSSATGIGFSLYGNRGLIDLGKLASAHLSVFNTHEGFDLSLPSLASFDSGSLNAYSGSKMDLGILANSKNLRLHSENPGSEIVMSGLTSLQRDPALSNDLVLEAIGGGLFLPALTSITRAGTSFDGGDLRVQGQGFVSAPVLSDITGLDFLQANQGATFSLPSLVNWVTPAFETNETVLYSDDQGTHVEFPNLLSIAHKSTQGSNFGVFARSGGTISFPKLNSVVNASPGKINFSAQAPEQISLPALADSGAITFTFTGGVISPLVWTGAAGTSNWGDSGNWDQNRVPDGNDNVVIPDLPGTQTILLNVPSTVRSLKSGEGLTILPGQNLSITSGASEILGTFSSDQGTLVAYNTATFTAATVGTVSSSKIFAYSGGQIIISGLTTATNLHLLSENAGSLISLPDLSTIQRDPNAPNDVALYAIDGSLSLPGLTAITRLSNAFNGGFLWAKGVGMLHLPILADITGVTDITVTEGGQLSLPGVTTLTTPSFDSYSTTFSSYGYQSFLEMPNLTTLTHSNPNGYQLGLLGIGGGTVSLPQLTTIVRGTSSPGILTVGSGGVLKLPQLKSLEKLNLNLGSFQSSIDLSKVEKANQALITTMDGFSLQLPALKLADASSITAYSGSKIDLPGLNSSTNIRLRSENSGTTIIASNLQTLQRDANLPNDLALDAIEGSIELAALTGITRVGTSFYSGTLQIQGAGKVLVPQLTDVSGLQYLIAQGGGQISLPSLTSWVTPNFENYETTLVSTGSGSLVEMANLISITHANPSGYRFGLGSYNGGTIQLPALETLKKSNYGPITISVEYGGHIDLPKISTLESHLFYLSGKLSSINLDKLDTGKSLNINAYDGFSLKFPNLINFSSSILQVGSGAKVELTNLTVGTNLNLNSSGSGTQISFPSLVTLQKDASLPNEMSVSISGGSLDLPALKAMNRVGTTYNGAAIYVQGTGLIQAPILEDASGIDVMQVSQGGYLSLPGLTKWATPAFDTWGTRVISNDLDSLIDFPNLVSINQANTSALPFVLEVQNWGTIGLPKLTTLAKTNAGIIQVNVYPSGNMEMPELVSANAAFFYLNGTQNSTDFGKLASANGANFQTYEGFVLNLPSLVSANSTTFFAHSGSKILASSLAMATNLRVQTDSPGSSLIFSKLDTLQRDRNEPNNLLVDAYSGSIEFPALTKFLDSQRDGSTYVQAANQGVIKLGSQGSNLTLKNSDIYQQTNGFILICGGQVGGPSMDTGTLILQAGGALNIPGFRTKGGIQVDAGADWMVDPSVRLDETGYASAAPLGILRVTGDFGGSTIQKGAFQFGGTLVFQGGGSQSEPRLLEAMGADQGNSFPLNNGNFYIEKLELANSTYVKLIDQFENSNEPGADALYLGTLVVPYGCTLDLNGVQVYAKNLIVDGTVLGVVATKFTSANATANTYGSTGTFTVTASANPGVINFDLAGNVPAGVKINPLSGLMEIGPKVAAGVYQFQITASNLLSPKASQDFTLTVNKAALTILAEDQTKVYGDAMPTLTTKVTGLVNDHKISDIIGLGVTTTATGASPVGTYALKPTGSIANYEITLVDGTLAVTKAELSITAEDKTKVYGDALPGFTTKIVGLKNGDTPADLTGLGVSTTAAPLSPVGLYDLVPSGSNPNYHVTLFNGVLSVTKANQILTWADPASITYGTKLSTNQLNASVAGVIGGTDPGSLTYNRAVGDLLDAGSYSLTVTAAETPNYFAASKSVTLVVNKATQTITWPTPDPITYGTKLSTTQLNATVSGVEGGSGPGTLAYGQSIGDLLNAGTTTLTVSAAETLNYLPASSSVTLFVNKANQTIAWDDPAAITYGTKLSATQLNATVTGVEGGSGPGSLTFGQAIGDMLNAGSNTLTVTAAGTENYLPASKSVTLVVNKANQTLSWATPDPITYGIKLSETQLNAKVSGVEGGSAPGALTYNRALGDLLNAGFYQIQVTAQETENYLSATQMVGLQVNKANQTITWSDPQPITYGTKLSSTQLNATVAGVSGGSDPGLLSYDRAVGDFLAAGTYQIQVTAAETDNYLVATRTVGLTVNKASQIIEWATPDPVEFGTKLSETQLNAKVSGVEGGSAPGGLTYNHSIGELLQPGSYPLTVNAAETDNYLSATKTVTLIVTQLLITNDNKATFEVGKAASFTFTATGFPTPTFQVKSGVLPAGITLSSQGNLSGTAKVGAGKIYSFVVAATNSIGGEQTQNFTLTVNEAPAITSKANAAFESGKSGLFTFAARGFPLPTFSLKSGVLPEGVTLDSAGLLSGIAKAGTGKNYPLTVVATNGIGSDSSQAFSLTINEAPKFTNTNQASFEVGKSGTFTLTTSGFPAAVYSLKSGTLPSGVTLSSSGVLSGTAKAGTAKAYTLTFNAINGIGSAATQSFTLNINQPPAFTSANRATFDVGKAGSFTLGASGFPGATFSVKTGTLPSGLTLSSSGLLSGTAKAGMGKNHLISFFASNGIGSGATQDFTLTVRESPAFTSVNKAAFEIGKAGSFNLTASGFPTASFSLKSGTLPSGIALSSSGVLSGTAKAGTAKAYTLTFAATNSVGSEATQAFTLNINQVPAFTNVSKTTFEVGKSGSFALTASGFPSPTFSLKSGTLPEGITLSPTGVLSGTAKAGTGKSYALTVMATNGTSASATQDFTLTVNQAPVFTSASKGSFEVGKSGSFSFTVGGFPASTFSLKSGTLPEGLTLNSSGVLSGTPAQGTGNNYPVRVAATNGVGAGAEQDFILTVNQPPVITSGNSTGFEAGKLGSFTVSASGFPAPTFSVSSGTLPSGIALTPAGVLSGTPAPGTAKLFTFTIAATNGVGTPSTQSFQLTVGSPPVITSPNQTNFVVGQSGSFTFQASGFPSPTYEVTSGTLPGGLVLSSAGILSGNPLAGSGKTYPLTVRVSNGIGSPGTQNFTLTVNESPSFTNQNKAFFEAGKSNTFTFSAAGFPAPTFKISAGALPAGLVLSQAGVLSGTPAANTAKVFPVTVTATNGIGSAASQSFSLTVGSAAKITSAAKTAFQVGKSGSFQVTASGFPAPAYSVSDGTLPSGITLSPTGLLSGKAAVGTGKTYSFTIAASNSIGVPSTQSFSLTVNEIPAFTSANTAIFEAGKSGSFKVTTTGMPVPTLALTAGTLPSGLTFDAKTGTLSGTPSLALPPSTIPLTFKSTNGVGSATQAFSLILLNPSFTYIPEGTIPILTTTNGAANGVSIWGSAGKKLGSINPYPGFTGKINTVLADLDGDRVLDILTSPGAGMAPLVKIFDGRLLKEIHAFNAYDSKFTGGVSVAVGDLDGDGTLEIVTSPGKGSVPQVKIFDEDGKNTFSFNAYDSSNKNGLTVMVADTDLNGESEIITIPGLSSSSQLKRFDHKGNLLATIQAYETSFLGGVSVALGDIDGKSGLEIIATSLGGRATTIRTFTPSGTMLTEITPVANLNRGGTVAVGDVDGDQRDEIVFATSTGVAPTVKVFDNTGKTLAQAVVYDSKFVGGVTLSLVDTDGDDQKEIATAPGRGMGPLVKRFNGKLQMLDNLFAAPNTFTGGIWLG